MTSRLVFPLLAVAFLASHVGPTQAGDTFQAEFRTMRACLQGIQKSTKRRLQVVTDKPHQVSGVLSNGGGFFSCVQRVTGTKGTYYEGTYTLMD